jgi:hypothetical protein
VTVKLDPPASAPVVVHDNVTGGMGAHVAGTELVSETTVTAAESVL